MTGIMCGRYTLTVIEGFEDFYEIDERVSLEPRYNIAPTQQVPVVRREPDGTRALRMMHWGLIPAWSDGLAANPGRLINARSESVGTRPSFKEAYQSRRCLVPADGFYEWRKEGRARIPIFFSLQTGGLFAFAGLWECWKGPDDLQVLSTTVLTTKPNALVAPIHDRMPVLLTRDRFRPWLDLQTPEHVLQGLMTPLPAEQMRSREVSQKVNSARSEGPELLEEAPGWQQKGLF